MEEGSEVAIAHEVLHERLETSAHLYDSNVPALTAFFSAADEAFPSSLVLRNVIHEKASDLLPPSSAVEDEVEFLSLSIDAEEEEKEEELLLVEPKPSQLPLPPQDPPWLRQGVNRHKISRSPLLELHREIVAFCDLVSPTTEDHQLRTAAVQRVSNVIKSIWNKCQVNVFGSFATGLYLPSSDIDVVILDSRCCGIQSGLRALAKAFTREGVAKKIQVIGKARVPIIKFVEIESNVSFDVSFDLENGPEAARFIKDALHAIPPLRPLCLVLKTFLQQRELNEVYTGGIGSYALLVMLLTYLQTRASKLIRARQHEQSRLEQNLGILLVDFLDFYGHSLNFKEVGISCREGGHFFKKKERGFLDSKKPFMLTVEDPQAPENDIAKSSYNFQKVRVAFLLAHRQLTNLEGDNTFQAGLLARIVRVDEKLAARRLSAPSSPNFKKKKKKTGKGKQKRIRASSLEVEEQSPKRRLKESRVHKRSRSTEHQSKRKFRKLNDKRRSHFA